MRAAALCAVISLLAGSPSFAQTIQKLKDKSALLDTGDLQMKVGEEYYAVTETGKKTALLVITQVRGHQAIGKITKGAAVVGQPLSVKSTAVPKPADRDANDNSNDNTDEYHPRAKPKKFIGILGGYEMDSMSMPAGNVNNVALETAAFAGTGFSLKGFYDWPLSDTFTIRLSAGYDSFNGNYSAKSTAINKNASATSSVTTTLIDLDGEIHWNIYRKSLTTIHFDLGYGYDYIVGLTTNLISLQAPSYLSDIYFGGGANIKMSSTSFLPVFAHYHYFQTNPGVTQSAIEVGAGWGWAF